MDVTAISTSSSVDPVVMSAGQLIEILRLYDARGLDLPAAHVSAALDALCVLFDLDREGFDAD